MTDLQHMAYHSNKKTKNNLSHQIRWPTFAERNELVTCLQRIAYHSNKKTKKQPLSSPLLMRVTMKMDIPIYEPLMGPSISYNGNCET